MKLNRHIKEALKRSHEIDVSELKFFFENYGSEMTERFLKLVYYINKRAGRILVTRYSSYTKFSSNYYNNTSRYEEDCNGFFVRYEC